MMILTKFTAEMCVSVSKCLGNGTSDGKKNHISQVNIRTVNCFINEYTFFNMYLHIQILYRETKVISKQQEENQFACKTG